MTFRRGCPSGRLLKPWILRVIPMVLLGPCVGLALGLLLAFRKRNDTTGE